MLKQSIVVNRAPSSAFKKILIPLCHHLVILIIKGEIEAESNNKEGKGQSYTDRRKHETLGLFIFKALAVT
jgi:hypothetical protein